jgi:formylglycine-generating enzyme required for sulfatase activity/subtilisin-like proprotein convertase family protein
MAMKASKMLVAALVGSLWAGSAGAVPRAVPYVGYLTAEDGTPFSGTVAVTMALYEQAEGGVAVWGPHEFAPVLVEGGVLSLVLGGAGSAPLDGDLLGGGALWLAVTVEGALLAPRQELLAVPYALLAGDTERLGGEPAASFVTDAELPDFGDFVRADALASLLAPVATSGAYGDLSDAPDLSVFLRADGRVALTGDLDAAGHRILNLALDAGAAPPPAPGAGQLWWDAGAGTLRVWTGSEWVAAGGTGAGGVATDLQCTACVTPAALAFALAAVATSGAYGDLTDRPDLGAYVLAADLQPVCWSGSYDDLLDAPDLALYLRADEPLVLGGDLDLAGHRLVNLAVDASETAPAGPRAGQLWWDPTGSGGGAGALKVWTGTLWLGLGAGGGALPADGLAAVSNGTLTNFFSESWASAAVPVDVPDNYPPGVTATIEVAETGTLRALTVAVRVDHPDAAELVVTLFAPGGHEFKLHDRTAGEAGGLDRRYPPAAPAAGDLATLLGTSPAGTWTLHVADPVYSGGDPGSVAGTIEAFALSYEVLRDAEVAVTGTLTAPTVVAGGLDVAAELLALRAELWCLKECDPARLGDCRDRACDGVTQSCTEGGALADGTACAAPVSGEPGRCVGGACCVPTSCYVLRVACGPAADGCGGVLDCGTCQGAGEVCFEGSCCVPATCAELGKECGSWDDGCGGDTGACGSCLAGHGCDAAGQCQWDLTCGATVCPPLAGYAGSCNARGFCEYANPDTTGWRAHDVWIWVPPGSFPMGAPAGETHSNTDERPVHTVTFAQGFFVAKYEVTVAQYAACQTVGACTAPGSGNTGATQPRDQIDWAQAGAVCGWLGGRRPSEAEWEYAAKGPVHRLYPWGDEPASCDRAVYSGCGGVQPVGSKPAGASWCGALDMAGNLWEWVADWYHSDYNGAPTDGSAWVDPPGSSRVLRGGSFGTFASGLRSAGRYYYSPTSRGASIGARCFRGPVP